jgi:hypothetical protein
MIPYQNSNPMWGPTRLAPETSMHHPARFLSLLQSSPRSRLVQGRESRPGTFEPHRHSRHLAPHSPPLYPPAPIHIQCVTEEAAVAGQRMAGQSARQR